MRSQMLLEMESSEEVVAVIIVGRPTKGLGLIQQNHYSQWLGSLWFTIPSLLVKETEQGVALAIIQSVVVFKTDPWTDVSDNAKDLVQKMFNPDPKQWLTTQEVIEHPWLLNAKKAPNVPLVTLLEQS